MTMDRVRSSVLRAATASSALFLCVVCVGLYWPAHSPSPQSRLQVGDLQGSSVKAVLGGKSRLASMNLVDEQQLAGWNKEVEALTRLEKKAEVRLQKDEKASLGGGSAVSFDARWQGLNSTGGSMGEVDDEKGEFVPEETLGAEAAALGFSTVAAWRQALHGHELDSPAHPSPAVKKATVSPHNGESMAHVVKDWLSFVSSQLQHRSPQGEQQLYLQKSGPLHLPVESIGREEGSVMMARPGLMGSG